MPSFLGHDLRVGNVEEHRQPQPRRAVARGCCPSDGDPVGVGDHQLFLWRRSGRQTHHGSWHSTASVETVWPLLQRAGDPATAWVDLLLGDPVLADMGQPLRVRRAYTRRPTRRPLQPPQADASRPVGEPRIHRCLPSRAGPPANPTSGPLKMSVMMRAHQSNSLLSRTWSPPIVELIGAAPARVRLTL